MGFGLPIWGKLAMVQIGVWACMAAVDLLEFYTSVRFLLADGEKTWKRGLLVYGAGMVISLATVLVMPSAKVMFGVLTLLGSCMILMIPFHLIGQNVNAYLGVIVSFGLFLFTYPVNRGYFGLGMQKIIELPKNWYANAFTTYLGFMEKGFFSTDYFSLLPWFFLFVTGYFLYYIVFGKQKSNSFAYLDGKSQPSRMQRTAVRILGTSICPPLGWIGKRALIIYMLHQPIIYLVLSIIEI